MTPTLSTAFRLAWFLASIGFLADATAIVMKEAAHAQRHGLVSLSALNRAFMAPGANGRTHSGAGRGSK